jgi:glutaminyl-peptide cyclotransferase
MTRAMNARTIFLVAFLLAVPPHCVVAQTAAMHPTASTPEYNFKILHSFPHDRGAFTQGLAFRDGFLYEGTGIKGRSSLRKVRLETGESSSGLTLFRNTLAEGSRVTRTKSSS